MTIQSGLLLPEQRASLQHAIEAAVVAHASLVDAPDAEADNALRLAAASSAGVQICEGLQKEAVGKARQAGRSWAELGALMGITRQAAQQRFTPSGKKEWFPKEWIGTWDGIEIKARNSWNDGLKLYVDGLQVAENGGMFALDKTRPFVAVTVARADGKTFLVEVFAYALFSVSIKIVVDGKQIAGDVF
ncbi:hypothetical protein [Massilia brevitalea]|uniref:hypothetical protein n=1 Tax=Massilia brevitalea TaxID=442526 RepID=UPI0027389F60|nr:hypothetical protein [Massilia brevitalea]